MSINKEITRIISHKLHRFCSPCFVPLSPQHASILACSHLQRNRSVRHIRRIESVQQQQRRRVLRSLSGSEEVFIFQLKGHLCLQLPKCLEILTFTSEEENSKGLSKFVYVCYFKSVWMRGYWLKCVSCRTVNGAELPLVSAGEDFFVQRFSLLELALFQVTGCLRNTRETNI